LKSKKNKRNINKKKSMADNGSMYRWGCGVEVKSTILNLLWLISNNMVIQNQLDDYLYNGIKKELFFF